MYVYACRRAARLGNDRPLHDKQLENPTVVRPTEQFRRSLFGLVECYNALPKQVVDTNDVKSFQKKLQEALNTRGMAKEAAEEWQSLYTTGWKRLTLHEVDQLCA